MSQIWQNFVKFQKIQLENLVDFEKCCKTHIFLQKSEPIQPKTSNILPNICEKLTTTRGKIEHFVASTILKRAFSTQTNSPQNDHLIGPLDQTWKGEGVDALDFVRVRIFCRRYRRPSSILICKKHE